MKIKLLMLFLLMNLSYSLFAESKEAVKEKKEKGEEMKKVQDTKTFLTHKNTKFRLVKDGDGYRLEKVVPLQKIKNEDELDDKQKQLDKPIKIKIKFQAEEKQKK